MPPPSLNRAQCRELDRRATQDFGIPSLLLMENAGAAVARQLLDLGVTGPVVICCGKGNNAGDGFVIARHLELFRAPVRVMLWARPADLNGDAATNYRILQRSGVTIEVLANRFDPERLAEQQAAGAAWFVDALLGTGAQGDPRSPLNEVIEWLNASPVPKLAVDVPSGLDCDTGQPGRPTIRAEHTCTFVAPKPGFFAAGAEAYTGQVHVVQIGAPRKLVERMLSGRPGDAA